jgi:hypothetical protein
MTTLTDTQVVTASGGLVELGYTAVTSNTTVAGGSWLGVATTTVVADGSKLLVEFQSPYVSAAANARLAIAGTNYRFGDLAAAGPFRQSLVITPSAGSVTVTVEFSAAGSSTINGSGGTYGAGSAFLRVSKIVQATQWPAVTTGTITCTSATRPSSPIIGQQILETDTGQQYYWDGAIWRGTTVLNYNAQTGTTYTFVMADASTQMVTLSNASAITATIPTNATTPFPTGTVLNFMQTGAGQVTIQGAGGVTVNTHSSKTKTAGQWASGSAMKTATDTWVLFGNLA